LYSDVSGKVNSINENMLDPMIRDKISVLTKKKQKLVEIEDFDKAKDLKIVIDKIKILGAQIAKMEFQKKQSIEAEDYDTSKMMKFEIDRLREAAFSFDTDRLLTPISYRPKSQYERMPEDVIETEADLIERSIKDLQEIEEENMEYDEDFDQNQVCVTLSPSYRNSSQPHSQVKDPLSQPHQTYVRP